MATSHLRYATGSRILHLLNVISTKRPTEVPIHRDVGGERMEKSLLFTGNTEISPLVPISSGLGRDDI